MEDCTHSFIRKGGFYLVLESMFLNFFLFLSDWSIPAALLIGSFILGFPPSEVQQIFIDCGLAKKVQKQTDKGKTITKLEAPKIKSKIQTNYGYDLFFTPPGGFGISDFENKKEAIEQALNAEVTFQKGVNNQMVMSVITTKLEDRYDFEMIETNDPVEFPLGYTKKGLITFKLDDSNPNLLIGGVPGSGKSVLERLIITYLGVVKATAGLLKLHLIDLKGGVEFGMFERCSFVSSYATNRDPLMLIDIFQYLNDEMERRYEVLKEAGYTNINEYNQGRKEIMPYCVVIIDEIANLESKECWSILTDLLRMGRASGLYFVMATQRPSADVLPGSIKANIPATIAFLSRNAVNSQILLDHAGAEKLKGKGHGILQSTTEVEFQCFFLDFPEARAMIKPFIEKIVATVTPIYDTTGVIDME